MSAVWSIVIRPVRINYHVCYFLNGKTREELAADSRQCENAFLPTFRQRLQSCPCKVGTSIYLCPNYPTVEKYNYENETNKSIHTRTLRISTSCIINLSLPFTALTSLFVSLPLSVFCLFFSPVYTRPSP